MGKWKWGKIEYESDENVIALNLDIEATSDEYRSYYFETDDPDSDQYELFAQIAYDAIEELAKGHAVIYHASYKTLRNSKKRFFIGIRPAKFSNNGATTRLKKYLEESDWDDGWYADVTYCKKDKKAYYAYEKNLFILQNQLNMELFRRADTSNEDAWYTEISLKIFPESEITPKDNSREIIECYRKTNDYILHFFAEIYLLESRILLNTKYMSEQELIEKLKPIVEKYGKRLEVNI
ncbi:MAG: hypothetical protein RSA27_07760 [Oscillospiraceae bacterium]